MSDQHDQKVAAARAAVASVSDGAIVGLGSGTTAEIMLAELAARVREGLHVTGVPTSERTRMLATNLGIPLVELDDVETLTLSIDGADEVTLPRLDLIKGRGGALLREKLTAAASRFRIIIVDASKVVPALGTTYPVPVEVVRFGWRHTKARLAALGMQPVLRVGEMIEGDDLPPFITDGGNYILDCRFEPTTEPDTLAQEIKAVPGVVEHGLFVGMTERVYVAGDDGVHVYNKAL
ncbi:MAG: ribose-5-phosphate isomerase RpiA [Ktedonobacterales bacterium]